MTDPQYSLEEIIAHPKFPFKDWKSDDLSFLMLELFWAEFFRDIVGQAAPEWGPRFDTARDGNPILALYHPKSRRAFRIIVITNDDDRPVFPEAKGGEDAYYYLFAFMNASDEDDGLPPWNELGFFAELDPSMIDTARLFIEQHCVQGKSHEEMEDAIAAYEHSMEMHGGEGPDPDEEPPPHNRSSDKA